ncbi:sulfotransferase [Vibrio breoganii]|uniref:sulfotransferase n=1 Tax=Vibrio breoganii TaxID=553239 RepID=UPI000C81761E|nr:sulfotransferase [Vibrio breoganii]PMO34030.1 hypothetical protein BCT12_01480 [Vibrio breoganii]
MRKYIFIIGAARSGTHFVASTLNGKSNKHQYLAEINEFWHQFDLNDKLDFPDNSDNKNITDKIYKKFNRLVKEEVEVVIEKTASNVFRVDMLCKAFPNSTFIYVHRNSDAVVESVVKKNQGDFRKISKVSRDIKFVEKVKFLFQRLISKAKNNKYSFFMMMKDPITYLRKALSIVGLNKSSDRWGPRFSMENEVINLPLKDYAYLQWEVSVTSALNSFDKNNIDYIDVDFDLIITDGDYRRKIERMLGIVIGDSNIEFKVDKRHAK